jgi:hypothetical protein
MVSVAESKVLAKKQNVMGLQRLIDWSYSNVPKTRKTIKAFRKFKLGDGSNLPSIWEPPQEIAQELIKLDKSNQFLWALVKIDLML